MLFIINNNPITIWLKWLIHKKQCEYRNRKNFLRIGYMSRVSNCRFGIYNTIYDGVTLENVEIGDFTYVATNSKLSKAIIGKFVCVGPDVICGSGMHPTHDFVSTHPIFYSTRKQSQLTFVDSPRFEEFAAITIGNDVWVGTRAIIGDGVRIGDGAIIGAGAVVTRDVEAYSVVGGVPARKLRMRFEPKEIQFLQRFKWWERDVGWLRRNADNFCNVGDLMKHSELGQ